MDPTVSYHLLRGYDNVLTSCSLSEINRTYLLLGVRWAVWAIPVYDKHAAIWVYSRLHIRVNQNAASRLSSTLIYTIPDRTGLVRPVYSSGPHKECDFALREFFLPIIKGRQLRLTFDDVGRSEHSRTGRGIGSTTIHQASVACMLAPHRIKHRVKSRQPSVQVNLSTGATSDIVRRPPIVEEVVCQRALILQVTSRFDRRWSPFAALRVVGHEQRVF